jgi:eukaryotic-like serine/threonine-protein kinase
VHRAGIIHRDLKPSNLVLRKGSPAEVVLIDFGVARRLEGHTGVTETSALVGTPHYMAPEQASGARTIPPAADVFALGCIFYECLTGVHPFRAAQIAGVLARILFDTPEPPSSFNASIPASWSELVLRMLAKRAEDRPADGDALLLELSKLPEAPDAPSAGPGRNEARAEGGDQVLVCAVLANLPASVDEPDGSADEYQSISEMLGGLDCPIARLADGSWLMTVLPRASATDQVRIAARSAMALRERVPGARIAIATGRAPLRAAAHVGEAVDRAAQLLDSTPSSGAIRLDSVTAGLLGERFVTETRESMTLLTAEVSELDSSRPLLGKPTPCVGRELELTQLESLIAGSVEEASPKAAVVIGPPGIGKSRLRHEFLRRVRERYPRAVALVGYGDPMNAGSPYVLLGDALRRYAEIRVGDAPEVARGAITERLCRHVPDDARARVAQFLGEVMGVHFPSESSPPLLAARADARVMGEQIALAFADWAAAECAEHPLVIVLEDVQWGDVLTVKLLESTLRQLGSGRVFVLALGRPELEQSFPQLFGPARALSMTLGALGKKASERLVRGALGESVEQDSVDRIVRSAAGNALFLEELVRASAGGKSGEVPETVLAMLQARLSRLEPEPRALLRAASIFGETFWATGVERVCAAWSKLEDPSRWLSQLVLAEIIESHRVSRLPGHAEYGFRHALVRDAAQSLLTDSDRWSGHRAAGTFLEEAGEVDAMVLAHHADEAGDSERATRFWSLAARSSLANRDIEEALARAELGIARGAGGETRGELLAVKCAAYYALGRLSDAADTGVLALGSVLRGGSTWCSTVEKLLQVFPNLGQPRRSQALQDELLRTTPTPDARMDYLRVMQAQLFTYALGADRERGEACLQGIAKLGSEDSYDVVTRGHAKLWRCIYSFLLGREPLKSIELCDAAIVALRESRVTYRVSFAYTLRSSADWCLGDLEQAERDGLEAYALGKESNDEYHAALGNYYVALALSEQPERFAEAERFAAGVRPGIGPLDEPLWLSLTSRIALTRGDFGAAEAGARKARAALLVLPPWGLLSSSQLLEALVHLGRADEAASIAREDLVLMDRIGSPMFTEIPFRVAVAIALNASGDASGARASLAIALRELDARAAAIPELRRRELFLARRENRRALELARELGA